MALLCDIFFHRLVFIRASETVAPVDRTLALGTCDLRPIDLPLVNGVGHAGGFVAFLDWGRCPHALFRESELLVLTGQFNSLAVSAERFRKRNTAGNREISLS